MAKKEKSFVRVGRARKLVTGRFGGFEKGRSRDRCPVDIEKGVRRAGNGEVTGNVISLPRIVVRTSPRLLGDNHASCPRLTVVSCAPAAEAETPHWWTDTYRFIPVEVPQPVCGVQKCSDSMTLPRASDFKFGRCNKRVRM
ncbi:MAG: hypothetical protein V1778_02435 [bacterium]